MRRNHCNLFVILVSLWSGNPFRIFLNFTTVDDFTSEVFSSFLCHFIINLLSIVIIISNSQSLLLYKDKVVFMVVFKLKQHLTTTNIFLLSIISQSLLLYKDKVVFMVVFKLKQHLTTTNIFLLSIISQSLLLYKDKVVFMVIFCYI